MAQCPPKYAPVRNLIFNIAPEVLLLFYLVSEVGFENRQPGGQGPLINNQGSPN